MSKTQKPSSTLEFLDLLDSDLLFGPLELAENKLRMAGLDPAAIGQRGSAMALKLQEKRRLAWQQAARRRLDSGRRLSSDLVELPTDRSSLLALVQAARSDTRFAGQVEMAFRDRSPEEADSEELRGLLEDIKLLERLEDSE